MRWIKKIITRFVEWLQREYKYKYDEDFSESVEKNTIYIIGNAKHPWLVALKCPCGCNETIQLNLLKEANPKWNFKISKWNRISISPSIWRTTGCKSHFYVINGRIEWARIIKFER